MGRAFAVSTVLQAAQGGNANGVAMDIAGLSYVGIQVVGAGFTGTVNFEVTVDGSNWVALSVTPSAGGAAVTTVTASALVQATIFPYTGLRARTSGVSGGTVTVTAYAQALD